MGGTPEAPCRDVTGEVMVEATRLPADLLAHALSFLGPFFVIRTVELVNGAFKEAARRPELWQGLVRLLTRTLSVHR